MGRLITVEDNDIIRLGRVHKGYKHERMKYDDNERERIFYREWKKENRRLRHIDYGQGTLQDIFAIPSESWWKRLDGWKIIINKRDQYIVATVIQWLGTNCGWGFLCSVLRQCGYEIVKTDKQIEKERLQSIKKLSEINRRFKVKLH